MKQLPISEAASRSPRQALFRYKYIKGSSRLCNICLAFNLGVSSGEQIIFEAVQILYFRFAGITSKAYSE